MRVISVARVVLAEVAEAERVQVPFVSGITEGAEIGVVRGNDRYYPTRPHQPVELLHRLHHVADMFDHMDGAKLVEAIVNKGVREQVEVRNHVRAGARIAVKADGAGMLVDSTADVKDALGH